MCYSDLTVKLNDSLAVSFTRAHQEGMWLPGCSHPLKSKFKKTQDFVDTILNVLHDLPFSQN